MLLVARFGLVGIVLSFAAATADAQDIARRDAGAILAEFDGVVYPSFSDGSDPEATARFTKTIDDAAHRQEALALELLMAHPGHARVPELMRMRWQLLVNVDHDSARVREETTRYVAPVAGARTADARLVKSAHVLRAWACVDDDSLPAATRVADLERALQIAPDDFLAQSALLAYARTKSCDPVFQRDVAKRILELDPRGEGEGPDARKFATLLEKVGRPLAAEFVDAATSKRFSLSQLRGHPVLISFFPTPWSDREPHEAAALRALAETFASKGVEFIVVHTVYGADEVAGRRRHLAELALPGRAHLDLQDEGPSLEQRLLDVDLPSPTLLLDGEGRLVATCFSSAPLRDAIARLLTPRRPI